MGNSRKRKTSAYKGSNRRKQPTQRRTQRKQPVQRRTQGSHYRKKTTYRKPVSRSKRIRQHSRTIALLFVIIVIILTIVISASVSHKRKMSALNDDAIEVSQIVMEYEDLVDHYAQKYEIEEYKEYLLAIIEVESGGYGSSDVMHSSESAGLPIDTLGEEASIDQGCAHFAECLKEASEQGCDLKTAIQAYNYGKGFIPYVAENGGAYTFDLAQAFAKEKSGGATKEYKNRIAIERNGGWRYSYGNMFYVPLVEQYVTIIRELE